MLKGVRVTSKRIAKVYDSSSGVFTGEVVIKMFNEMDFREALSYQLEGVGGINGEGNVEIYEAREVDFTNAQNSLSPGNFENNTGVKGELATPLPMISEGAQVVKISGISSSLSTADLINIVSGQARLTDQGILRSIKDGIEGSEAFAILNSESDVTKLTDLLNK